MFGATIAELRRRNGWSQRELARRLNVSPSAVGMYEQDRREPSIDRILALSALFGVTADVLLCGIMHGEEGEILTDEAYMREAMCLAADAADEGEVPVGCVIVSSDGRIVGRGRNRREKGKNALAHAEVEAIAQACAVLGGWRLPGSTLFVTLEPCPMCAGAILNARIARVVYGTDDPKSGSCRSVVRLFDLPFNHKPELVSGVLQSECARQLSDFFRTLRQRRPDRRSVADPPSDDSDV